ncbi:hypothetical protein WM42_1632 [Corynebacterium simulans]|nr:hypothetical protein WM42_1632 [Corynebacterium simulans]
MDDEVLAEIARQLVSMLRRDAKTDWTVRDDVRAKLRRSGRRLLRDYKYSAAAREQADVERRG